MPARLPGKPSRKPGGRSSGLGSIPTQTGVPDLRMAVISESAKCTAANSSKAALTDGFGILQWANHQGNAPGLRGVAQFG